MKKYRNDYCVGNTYKYKIVLANSVSQAIKKSRLNKSIVDIQIIGEWYYLLNFRRLENVKSNI